MPDDFVELHGRQAFWSRSCRRICRNRLPSSATATTAMAAGRTRLRIAGPTSLIRLMDSSLCGAGGAGSADGAAAVLAAGFAWAADSAVPDPAAVATVTWPVPTAGVPPSAAAAVPLMPEPPLMPGVASMPG